VKFPIEGVRVGHWTGDSTGVTVLLTPDGTVGAGEVRGGAPASRELALLEPDRTVTRVDAVVFAGGSAFGLATADGVMRYLAERGVGFPSAGGPVPIVPTACVFDLAEHGNLAPGADEGYAAARAADRGDDVATGRVGAGRGATVGKWRGREHAVGGGVGVAVGRSDDATVAVLAVVNAVGDVIGRDGGVIAGSTAPPAAPAFPVDAPFEEQGANTTLVVVVTDAAFDKLSCHLVAQSAHDGLARALHPAHTRFDGDLAITLATGGVDTHLDRLRVIAADLVAEAIRVAPG
jgi:L-aminopeptidase/D-esterase-like protein